MSLQTRLLDFATAVATDYKQVRTWITGSSTGDLTGLATTNKSSIISAINEVNVRATGAPPAATETAAGVAEIATSAEATTGTADNLIISPLKLAQRLLAYAQPLSANLTSLADTASGSFGRQLLESGDADDAQTTLGLSAVALSGSASDITTGVLPASVLPPLAINDTFTVETQGEMLALTAQRGDVAIRTDTNRSYILADDDATVLANWKQLTAGGDVTSVAGRTGAVVLTKTDVGLNLVDNTSDDSKPVSSAQATAIGLRLLKSANLSDLANVATARTNLSVYSQADIGNPEYDLVAAYNTAKA